MIRFLAGRVMFGGLVLFALSVFVFFLFFIAPGDPARMIAGDKATEKQLIQIRSHADNRADRAEGLQAALVRLHLGVQLGVIDRAGRKIPKGLEDLQILAV